MSFLFKKGYANPIVHFFAEHPTTKAPVLGLANTDFDIDFHKIATGSGAQETTVFSTVNAIATLATAWSGGATGTDTFGVIEVDKGVYRLDCPVDICETGYESVVILIDDDSGTDFYVRPLRIELEDERVDVGEWLGQAVTADSNVPEVHVVGLDADVITNAEIADDALSAEQFKATMIRFTLNATSTTTNLVTTAITPSITGVVADQFKDRFVLFDKDTTTAGLRGAMKKITASSAADLPVLTVDTLPTDVANADTGTIV